MVPVLEKAHETVKFYGKEELKELLRSGNKIYGDLSAGIPRKINTDNVDLGNIRGKFGEALIGSMLNLIAVENKDMFIFHSVGNPDGTPGETDHILLYRNKLVLIETKAYSSFVSLNVTANGQLRGVPKTNLKTSRKLDNNNLIRKMEVYSKAFKELQVHAITAISRSNVVTSSENGKYKVISLDNLSESLSYHQAQASRIPHEVTYDNVSRLAALCL